MNRRAVEWGQRQLLTPDSSYQRLSACIRGDPSLLVISVIRSPGAPVPAGPALSSPVRSCRWNRASRRSACLGRRRRWLGQHRAALDLFIAEHAKQLAEAVERGIEHGRDDGDGSVAAADAGAAGLVTVTMKFLSIIRDSGPGFHGSAPCDRQRSIWQPGKQRHYGEATETSGLGNLNGTPTSPTATTTSGVATFSGLFITNSGSTTLTFTANGYSVASAASP